MYLTIERLRTLLLGLGAIVIVALVGFLAVGRWRSRLSIREIPKRLGVDIKQEANGVTYTQSHAGHTLFKIHASKVVQLKQSGRAVLHDVQIELYGPDGSQVDHIVGNEFEYDQKAGTASAAGPVEITVMRPHVMPAIVPKSAPEQSKSATTPLVNMAQTAASGQIEVKTSGLTFDQKSGKATTAQRVEFSTVQGTGSSIGATFDSDNGQLVLDHAVELHVERGADTVLLHARHAEFQRSQFVCLLRGATANYRNSQAAAGLAQILFRQDGSASRLNASDGFALTTSAGAHVTAPTGSIDFDEKNQPQKGRLEGGVTMDSKSEDRQLHGTAPVADLVFTAGGELRHAHLERDVVMQSEQTTPTEGNQPEFRERREWRSPVAEVDFRSTRKGQVEIASVNGTGGVIVTGETQRGSGPATPSLMAADAVAGDFGPGQILTQIVGTGHASMEQVTGAGAHQTISGDRIVAKLRPVKSGGESASQAPAGARGQVQSALVDGHVVLTEQSPAKPGQAAEPALRATAGHAEYEGSGEWLHLTTNPRVDDGGMQLTADRVDVSQATGDAFARGNVKATWLQTASGSKASPSRAQMNLGLGGQGPAHVIAAEAQMHRATGEITFRGQARLWQQANSISAPTIVLNRIRQTLVAQGDGAKIPVNVVLLTASAQRAKPVSAKANTPSVVRVRAGDFKYSEAERKAMLHAGPAGPVLADTGTATTSSSNVDLVLLPPGNHAAADGGAAQVDRMTAYGHVVVSSQGRRGNGDQLVYSSETGDYVLTGTAETPPRLIDPARGVVTGESLIFNSRDDSVSIEGPGHRTSTETMAPK